MSELELRRGMLLAAGCISSGEELSASDFKMPLSSLVPMCVICSSEKTFTLTSIAMLLAEYADERKPT